MKHDCEICCGSGRIRVPVHKSIRLSETRALGPLSVDEVVREYPCPECSEMVGVQRVAGVSVQREVVANFMNLPEYKEVAEEDVCRAAVEVLIKDGFFSIVWGPVDTHTRKRQVSATLGVVSPKIVATMEQRISARQDEVAREVASKAEEQILVWGSHYTGSEGPIHKQQAVDAVHRAFELVMEKRQPTKENVA